MPINEGKSNAACSWTANPSTIKQEIGDRAGAGVLTDVHRETATDLGQLSVASQAYEAAVRINEAIQNRGEAAYARAGLAMVYLQQAKLGEAHRHVAAREIWASLSDEEGAIQTELLSAVIDFEEGQLANRQPDERLLSSLDDVRRRAAQGKPACLEASARVAQTRLVVGRKTHT